MSFDGPALSIDDEGSILFDGEKIIVNVPVGHELLEHIGSEESIPFPVVYTHPSHHQNQQPSQDAPSLDDNPVIIKEKAQAFNENVRQKRESARNKESEPSTPDVPDDLPAETQPDIREKEVLEVCGEFCQQNPQAMTAVMNLIEGFEPDDDERTLEERVSNHLRIMGLNDAFGYGDWYTTRLGPIADSTAARIVDYYFDRVREATAGLVATAEIEGSQSLGKEHVAPAVSEPEPKFLNYHFMEHAQKNIDGWSETWTTEAEFSDFLLTHWTETYGIQVPGEIVEAPLEVQLAEFYLFVEYYRESYFSATGQYESPYPERILTEDYNDFLPLLALLNPAPLNDL